ncbi:MAG TPA: RNA 2',3'-cyclic phosphodiesterase [Nocardioides sp.]|uniref:RNA 2',3'-cyclic phosphodiesterase n=1 Tax=Nocardioides sp. TaxID=35761 RepID=UPI002D805439|nr:RNA 2',3'-cyclic phosphodiesterase [Nocardioides sp.]HET6651738.1 RNA 2',3'-cyclic phosphodiesterase [Nocardioides sp.]
MFVALLPPDPVAEDLAEFLTPRQEAGDGLRWTVPEQWHVTLAFFGDVAERHVDDLVERLGRAAARRTAVDLRISGAGAFPNPRRAKVVYAGIDAAGRDEELRRMATGARAAGSKSGAGGDGGRFHPHVTLARSGRPIEATRWIRVLDPYLGPSWTAKEMALVESHLGEGPRRRPRYEVVGTFALGGNRDVTHA